MIECNEYTARKLAEEVVDSMDLGSLIEYAVEKMTADYLSDSDGMFVADVEFHWPDGEPL
jgi:hypothetical protein